MQNYNTGYNYNQAYSQGYAAQNYANYGYDAQGYARQTYTQQLQQQLQPSIIQQTIQQQTNVQPQQQAQTILPNLGGTSINTSQPLIQLPQQNEKKQEAEQKSTMATEKVISSIGEEVEEKEKSKLIQPFLL